MNVEESQVVKDWLNDIAMRGTGADATQRLYIRRLQEYCDWRKMNPDELLTEDVPQRKGKKKTVAEQNVTKYFQFYTQTHERTTAKTMYGVLRSFFRFNEVIFYSKTPTAGSKAKSSLSLSKDKIKEVIDLAKLPTKYAITGLAGSGLRPGDFVKLMYGDVRKDYEVGEPRLYVEKMSDKEDLNFGVFLSRQATHYLRLMIEARKRKGEKMNNKSPLLAHTQTGWDGHITKGQLGRMVKQAGERAGIYLTPKMFRKNFRTLASPVIGRDAVCKMAAWTIPGVGGHYFLPSKDDCLESYRKIEDMFIYEGRKTNKQQAVENVLNFAIAQGVSIEELNKVRNIARTRKLEPDEVAKLLQPLIKQVRSVAGGAPFKIEAAKQLAEIFRLAIKEIKEGGE